MSTDLTEGSFPNDDKTQRYGNLFFLLQSEPKHIAHLCRLVNLSEIEQLLQTVMFTIYGNQYESREEHLLLTMFQVCPLDLYQSLRVTCCSLFLHTNSTTLPITPLFCVPTHRSHE